MNNMKDKFYYITIIGLFFTSCNSQIPADQNPMLLLDRFYCKGADVGWLATNGGYGYKFYDRRYPKGLLAIVERQRDKYNSVSCLNPSNDKASGHCSKEETVIMALRAKKMGMRIMINFHYSDTWADPGKQAKPTAWANHSLQNY
jgi:arabinogalactan endo-1,4-beta-galactosidase